MKKNTLISLLALASCLLLSAAVPNRAHEEIEIQRLLIAEASADVQRNFSQDTFTAYYVELEEGKDPSSTLLSKLSNSSVAYKAYSACSIKGGFVVDTASGKSGVIVFVRKIEWTSQSSVRVRYGWHTNGLAARSYDVVLTKGNNGWAIAETLQRVLS